MTGPRSAAVAMCLAVASLAANQGQPPPAQAPPGQPPTQQKQPPAQGQHTPLPPGLETQVQLDRAGFSPGEIDGEMGRNTKAALAAFTAAGGDERTLTGGEIEILTSYAVTPADMAGPYAASIPEDLVEQSKLPALDYSSALEAIAERFHIAPALLTALNSGVAIEAGQALRVPDVTPMPALAELKGAPSTGSAGAGSPPVSPAAPQPAKAARVVVSRAKSIAQAFDEADRIIFHAPVTSGSQHDPLPLGTWTVTAVTRNPTFHYNPKLFWDADPTHSKAKIPPGPNNPVGLIWIDISREHYGLHGTPEPGKVGHTSSHGCVRLTNWDAVRLAAIVSKGTPIIFER